MDPIEVFGVGPDGELVPIRSQTDRVWAGHESDGHGPTSVVGRSSGSADRSDVTYRARPGRRPGGYEDRKTRSGGREDVMAPVPVLPGLASRALNSGAVFEHPIPGIEVDVSSLEHDARGSSWRATVECGRVRRRRRAATLRAYPSPSLNLTILELVPTRPRLIHTGAFVEAGVPVIAALSSRLAAAAMRSTGG